MILLLAASLLGTALPPPAPGPAAALRDHLRTAYPSLAYVDRYRAAFPGFRQGEARLWHPAGPDPKVGSALELTRALVGLEDQHVSLAGAAAGPTETLGALFRATADGELVVGPVFGAEVPGLHPGDRVRAVDGRPAGPWLARAATLTFGGNPRSRRAEAALELGLGRRAAHLVAGLGPRVTLTLQAPGGRLRRVALPYLPMTETLGKALAEAVNRPTLPDRLVLAGLRVACIRIGAFAPQYDPAFTRASEDAAKAPGVSDDQAMVAGFQALVRAFVAQVDARAAAADVLVVDLRGNLGGFAREARMLAAALSGAPLPRSFDVFASGKPRILRLQAEPEDPAGSRIHPVPFLLVLTDAGTRSAGELMAAWLWGAGATVAGERTLGAGGGFEFQSKGFALPGSAFSIITSGNFTFFDCGRTLQEGETPETPLLEQVAEDGFAPSRTRPYAIQAAGLRPDVSMPCRKADLRDGGVAALRRVLARLQALGRLPRRAVSSRPPGAAGRARVAASPSAAR